jgi:LPXTG-site transpeptidase (sortase) family protein
MLSAICFTILYTLFLCFASILCRANLPSNYRHMWDTKCAMALPSYLTLRRFNNLLTAVVVLFALYIVLLPFFPALSWWVQHQAPIVSKPATVSLPEQIPADNTLVIPSLGMKQGVYDGPNKYTLRKGVWHRPQSSTPDKGSNTVFAGHRFTYHDPAVFYHLDKVKAGDPIVLYWNHKRYDYTVRDILTVKPTEIGVEAPTKDPLLTIYTCTPLWTSKFRLVIQAVPKGTT